MNYDRPYLGSVHIFFERVLRIVQRVQIRVEFLHVYAIWIATKNSNFENYLLKTHCLEINRA